MGGSGGSGGGYFPKKPQDLHDLIESQRMAEQQRIDSEVNQVLQDMLATLNQRDADKIQGYLKEIQEVLGEAVEIEQLLYGGSVAKHTYVDGLSDVDALVALDAANMEAKDPKGLLDDFCKMLSSRLHSDKVESVEKGRMAVTVTYSDGTEIQLLPALRSGNKIQIPTSGGKGWKETDPKSFQSALTGQNQKLNNALVPAIKLMKSINAGLPEKKQLTGYHIESLALEAAKGYQGRKTVKSVLLHVLEASSKRVMSPIQDVTGQSRTVDSYLGKAESKERLIRANALAGVARRLNAATTAEQWKQILED